MKTIEPVSVRAPAPPVSAERLPVLFADFLRLFFTYPDRSTRVQQAAHDLLDEIARVGPAAALRLQGDTRRTMVEFRKHFGWYTRGLPHATDLRQRLFQVESIAEAEEIFVRYLEPAARAA